MKSIVRALLVLHPEERVRECLLRAAEARYHVRAVPTWEELRSALREAPPSALVVVDPYSGNGAGAPAPALRGLLGEFPSSTVIAAMETAGPRYRDVHTLGHWGVVDVLSLNLELTPEAVRRRLQTMHGRALQRLLQRALPPTLPSRAVSIVMTAAETVSSGGHAADVARTLLVSGRTLNRWAVSAALPPPRRLLAWMRVLLAGALLDDPGRSVASVSQACGYSSDSALRTALNAFLGRSPKRLRQTGAFTFASEQFLADLASRRRARAPRPRLPARYGEL